MKKRVLQLLLIASGSFLLLSFAAIGARAQETGEGSAHPPGWVNLRGEIYWKKGLGVPPVDASENYKPLENICQPFFVVVMEAEAPTKTVVASATRLTRGRDDEEYYRCKYETFATSGKRLAVQPGMGDPSKPIGSSFYYKVPWKPPQTGISVSELEKLGIKLPEISQGSVSRSFDRAPKYVMLKGPKTTWLAFELGYRMEFESRTQTFYSNQIVVNPGWLGPINPLDWCREWENNCGKPAADAYCQSRGYEEAKGFVKLPNVPETATFTEKRICNSSTRPAGCDSFKEITCVRK